VGAFDVPTSMQDLIGKGRFVGRTAGFVGLTFSLYGMLELDTAASPAREREAVLHKWIRRYGQALLRLYGVQTIARGEHVEQGQMYPGCDAEGRGRIFVMNHRSGLDIPLTLAFTEATIVSRADLARWPVIGVAARRVGTLFVDRESKRSGAGAIAAMAAAVERGRGVMVYPEGTTYPGDEVRPLRAGAFLAAHRTGAEVVPVGLAYEGEGASFLEESFAEHMVRVSGTPATRAAIVVGAPIRGGHLDVDALRERAHQDVQALVHEARRALSDAAEGSA
jgi:lyso-ornithine lipid O-acyltransferase